MISAEAPVYKLRLGRPSRPPSMFINFEMDPHLCSSSQKHLFLIPISPKNLLSNSAQMSTQTSIFIHPLSPSCRLYSQSLPSVHTCLTTLQTSIACPHCTRVPCRSEPLITICSYLIQLTLLSLSLTLMCYTTSQFTCRVSLLHDNLRTH